MGRILMIISIFIFSSSISNGNTEPAYDDQNFNADSILNNNPNSNLSTVIHSDNYILYIGTYTDGGSKGIYKTNFNTDSLTFTTPELVATVNNPSFQCITNNKKMLWSVKESWSEIGQVIGFSIDSITGNLTKVQSFSSNGYSPCYVSYHQNSTNVFAANYSSGSIIQIPVTANGFENGASKVFQHKGTGPNKIRQAEPHAHCIKFDLDGKYAYACDLGADKIYIYTVLNGELQLVKEIITKAGSGPRHIDFHPSKKIMAVVNELNGTVVTYSADSQACFSIEQNTISTLPDSFKGDSKSADIHFSPNGKFLYASNRGNNSIVIYKVDDQYSLQLVDWHTQNISVTRNFIIEPKGNFLIAANQEGNNIVVFKIDENSGKLCDTGLKIIISKPVCLTLLKL